MDSLSQNENDLTFATSDENNDENISGAEEEIFSVTGTNDNDEDIAGTNSNSNISSNDLFYLLVETDWDGVRKRCQSHPEDINKVHSVSGRTPLHLACAIGSTPYDIIYTLATPFNHSDKYEVGSNNRMNNNSAYRNDRDDKKSSLLNSFLAKKQKSFATSIIMKQEKKYGDTPLHLICRNSQRTSSKVSLLLNLLAAEEKEQEDKMGVAAAGTAVLETNVFGGTPLHSACAHNAMFAVLQMIVQYNPLVLKKKTREGVSCLQALYFSYKQSIPGHLAIAMIVNSTLTNFSEQSGHFQRFWEKVQYLTLEYYKLTWQCPKKFKALPTTKTEELINPSDSDSNEYNGRSIEEYLVHGLIKFNAPTQLLEVALNLKMPAGVPSSLSWACVDDRDGNLPLHVLVQRRPFRGLKERSAIACMVKAYPDAIKRPNNLKQIPLMLAIRNKIPWDYGMKELIKHDKYIVSHLDPISKLYPFQLAAAVGGRSRDGCILTTIYELLIALPEVVTEFL